MTRHALVDNVKRSLARLGLCNSGMVVAVSGGHDSVALLLALLEAGRAEAPLVIAHLNHQIRGTESDGDERFVRELWEKLIAQGRTNVQVQTESIDVVAAANQRRENLEATARCLRYSWLAQVARAHQMDVVATGHTIDDQAETVLHRILRGTGFQGLRGIAFERELEPGIRLVRPLLTTTRPEVIAYLTTQGVSAREDSSNRDPALTRNRIRHELLPKLEEHYNPAIREVLARLAEQAADAHNDEVSQATELLHKVEKPRADRLVILDLPSLQVAPRSQVRPLFRLLWEREGWPRGEMSHEHWSRLVSVAHEELTAADFPGRIRANRKANVLQIGPIS